MKDDKIERYVYFARAQNMMKIGCSRAPLQRLVSISEWVPFKMEIVATVVGGFDLESSFHTYFEDDWSHLEWFHVSPKMEDALVKIQSGLAINLPEPKALWRKSEIKRLKNSATQRITKAEKRAGIKFSYPMSDKRPDYLNNAVATYYGAAKPAPDDYVLAAISQYERELGVAQ